MFTTGSNDAHARRRRAHLRFRDLTQLIMNAVRLRKVWT